MVNCVKSSNWFLFFSAPHRGIQLLSDPEVNTDTEVLCLFHPLLLMLQPVRNVLSVSNQTTEPLLKADPQLALVLFIPPSLLITTFTSAAKSSFIFCHSSLKIFPVNNWEKNERLRILISRNINFYKLQDQDHVGRKLKFSMSKQQCFSFQRDVLCTTAMWTKGPLEDILVSKPNDLKLHTCG